jgi:transcription initiation factor TFIIH subunit 1
MSGEGSSIKRYDADFKKVPGTLSITSAAIAWVPKTPGAMDRQSQALNRAIGMSYAFRDFNRILN